MFGVKYSQVCGKAMNTLYHEYGTISDPSMNMPRNMHPKEIYAPKDHPMFSEAPAPAMLEYDIRRLSFMNHESATLPSVPASSPSLQAP